MGGVKPRGLDLFCGAGGCTRGYQIAGFEMDGVDINPQPRYVGSNFYQADALEFVRAHGHEYDFIHASPVCKGYSQANNIHGRTDHPLDIPAVRGALRATGKPYVIENVPGAPLESPILLCGLALGCHVKRHRLFESNMLLHGTECPPGHPGDWLIIFGDSVMERGHQIGRTAKNGPRIRRKTASLERGRIAMGCDWMDRRELSQAIPPAYTKWIGDQLMLHLSEAA